MKVKSHPTDRPYIPSAEEEARTLAFFKKKLAALPPLRRKKKKGRTFITGGKLRALGTPEQAWALGAGKPIPENKSGNPPQ